MIDQVKLIIGAVILAATLLLGYAGYSHVKDIGYQEAKVECDEKFAEYQKKVNERLERIEGKVSGITTDLISSNTELNTGVSQILESMRNTPSVTIKGGKCVPTQEFVNNLNSAIEKANKKK